MLPLTYPALATALARSASTVDWLRAFDVNKNFPPFGNGSDGAVIVVKDEHPVIVIKNADVGRDVVVIVDNEDRFMEVNASQFIIDAPQSPPPGTRTSSS